MAKHNAVGGMRGREQLIAGDSFLILPLHWPFLMYFSFQVENNNLIHLAFNQLM
jgi:hypothetical protein